MKTNQVIIAGLLLISGLANAQAPHQPEAPSTPAFNQETLLYAGEEKHLSNVRQLTFGGDNAEAYFSFDSKSLTFQATNKAWNVECDQIYYYRLDQPAMKDGAPQLISTGKGRTTCSYFMPGDSLILYASTHEGDQACPPVPPRREDGKYVWVLFDE